jgi:hypothetical protein
MRLLRCYCENTFHHEGHSAAQPQPKLGTSRAKHAKGAKVTGLCPSSRADARDLRKISPWGRNDNKSELGVLWALAGVNPLFVYSISPEILREPRKLYEGHVPHENLNNLRIPITCLSWVDFQIRTLNFWTFNL